jgi:hypothetical protein
MLKITVTEENIKNGKFSPTSCAVALAMIEAGVESVSVHPNRDGLIHYGYGKTVKIPLSVLKFINSFDKRNEVCPITFNIKL